MKVLFLARSDIYKVSGGDTVQIEKTALELRKLGVDVDVSNTSKINLKPYDIVHVFQLDWVPETYFYVMKAKKAGKKVILSPIHHSEKEVKRFDDLYTFGLRKLVNMVVRSQEHRDILKNIFRGLFSDRSKLTPTIKGALLGYRNIQRKCLLLSDMVLVQTQKEAEDLISTYKVDFKWVKIANGVSEQFMKPVFPNEASQSEDWDHFFSASRESSHPRAKAPGLLAENKILDFNDYVICVGRIEARKNQLSIIQAVEELRRENNELSDLRLVFLGKKSTNHKSYVAQFDKAIQKYGWIVHPGYIPQEEIPSYFHFAKVCVSASWFETTGLTSIEALFCGTNVVASGARALEVLGELAEYCDPGDIESIKKAIHKAYYRKEVTLNDKFREEYTWKNVAIKTLEVYKAI